MFPNPTVPDVAFDNIHLSLRIGFGVFDIVVFSPNDADRGPKSTDINETENQRKKGCSPDQENQNKRNSFVNRIEYQPPPPVRYGFEGFVNPLI
jgi:hypothetical protein